jgi:DNA-binding SARP family transcriptional activator
METQRANPGPATARSVARPAARDAQDPPALRIRLLGELELRLEEAPLPPLESARAESLLAYLLLHRDAAQPRQRLAFLLWPDSTEPQARTNLRHVLHKLRRALPDADRFVDVGSRTLRWRTDAPVELDVATFEEALARAARDDGDVALAALQEAVAAYAGDLLEGSYDDWVLEQRERLRQRYLEALERLTRLHEQRGEAAQAVPYAERLLRHDPLREETYRLLMRLHDVCGNRARALRVYHACTATLERELGVEPSAATRQVYEGLLPAADEGAAGEEQARRAGSHGLVGRTTERTRLTELWREAERGHARLALVTGGRASARRACSRSSANGASTAERSRPRLARTLPRERSRTGPSSPGSARSSSRRAAGGSTADASASSRACCRSWVRRAQPGARSR